MNKKYIIMTLVITTAIAVWIIAAIDAADNSISTSVSDKEFEINPGGEHKKSENGLARLGSDNVEPAAEKHETGQESIEIRNWRMTRGYYQGISNDIGSKHPYELYDLATLEGLAENNDGMAQLVLGTKLAFAPEQKDKAEELYWRAAVNGYTAGLIYIAADRMILQPGSSSFAFDTESDDGEIADEYAERLKYFAAAEFLGDFVGSESLRIHMDPAGFVNTENSRRKVCKLGFGLTEKIRKERVDLWGDAEWKATAQPPAPVDAPGPYCVY